MAQEYIEVSQKHELGMIALSKSVFKTIAQIAVEEAEGLTLDDPFKIGRASCRERVWTWV